MLMSLPPLDCPEPFEIKNASEHFFRATPEVNWIEAQFYGVKENSRSEFAMG